MKTKRILALLLALVMVLTLVACGGEQGETTAAPGGSNATPEKKYAEKVVIGIGKDISTLDPTLDASQIEAQMVFYCSHETLTYLNPETHKIEADLAESWDISPDGLVYTFHLKKGVKFHNGEELKASDVKFSLERCRVSSTQKSRLSLVTDISVKDDYTVAITLSKVFLDFLYNLTQPNLSIFSEKAVNEKGDDGEQIGTGPYVITEKVAADHITLTRFEDYHGEKAITKTIEFKIIPEDATRVMALEAGEIDVCYSPAYVDHTYITDNKNLELISRPGTTTYYLAMNTQIAPFNNEKVRQAIACAVNKEDCISVAFGTTAIPADSVMPPSVPLYSEVHGYSRDLEKAKALLKEAGYENGFTMEIGVATDVHKNIAQVIQQNLKEIGITVDVKSYDANTLKDMTVEGTHQAASQNYGNGSGPDGSFTAPFSSTGSSNRSKVNDPWIDEMCVKAGSEQDEATRTSLYRELNQYITDKAYWVPIAIPNAYVGIRKGVAGALYASNIRHDFSGVYRIED